MKTIIFALSIAVLTLTVSCKKKAADVNPEFVGYWQGEGYQTLSIESNSRAVYQTVGGMGATVTVSGKAKVKGSVLKVLTKKFSIDQEPQKRFDTITQSTTYTMILDGVTYERW